MSPRTLTLLCAFAVIGCTDKESESETDTDADTDTDSDADTDTDTDTDTDSDADMASVSGNVTISVTPVNGGIGDLYIAVLGDDPLTTASPTVVSSTVLEDADFSDPEATLPYSLTGIPPRAEDYWISGFLDDNGNADPDDPGPDQNDPVMLDGFAVPTASFPEAGSYEQDLDLNVLMPF